MATKIGSLVLDIRTNTAKFVQGIGKSKKAVKGFKSSVGGLTAALGTLGGITGLAFVIKKSLEAADKIGKAADTVGLAVESYQELQHAAELGGVAQSQFTSNMTAFIKRVGEAQAGMGPLVSGLKNIDAGLLKALTSTKSQEEALNLMADAIQNASSETERAALANAAFSRAGVAMTVFLKKGSKGLDEMRKRARDLGIVLKEDAVRGAEAANDKVTELIKVLKIQTVGAIAENAKAIETIVASALVAVTAIASVVKALTNLEQLGKNFAKNQIFKKQNEELEEQQKKVKRLIDILNGKSGVIQLNVEQRKKIRQQLNAEFAISKQMALQQDTNLKILTETTEQQKKQVKVKQELSAVKLDPDSGVNLDNLKTQSAQRLETLQSGFLAETQSLQQALINRQFIVEDAFQNDLISAETKNSLLEDLTRKHEAEKTVIAEEGAKARRAVLAGQLGAAASIFSSLSALAGREGKKQTALQKTLARASIIASTAQAVMNALATPPYPLGVALATAAALKGAEQLSKVGGGGGSSTSVSGLTQVSTGVDQGAPIGLTNRRSQAATQIVFTGDMLGEDLSERLIEIIRTATNDRDVIVFDSDSRQAQEVREAS